jgi:hypothetical protein
MSTAAWIVAFVAGSGAVCCVGHEHWQLRLGLGQWLVMFASESVAAARAVSVTCSAAVEQGVTSGRCWLSLKILSTLLWQLHSGYVQIFQHVFLLLFVHEKKLVLWLDLVI